MTDLPRGIRNHNPGNLDWRAENPWLGQIGREDRADGTPGRFARFKDPVHGLRALMRLLLTYYRRHRLKTVGQIIGRWAPTIENDTFNYARFVARQMVVGVNADIDLTNAETLEKLARAIVRHENGSPPMGYPPDWYPDETWKAAVKLALT